MSLAQQEFTNAGRSMLGRAQNGETLTITQIIVGSGVASQPSDLWPLTQLIAPEFGFNISAKNDDGNGQLLVEGAFRSDQISTAFYLRELGIMAHIGTEADRLYSVSNVFSDPPDYIDPAAPTVQAFKVKLVIDRIPTANLVIQIGPTDAVMGENVGADTVGPGVYQSAAGNVLYFKRLVEGPGIQLTSDDNTITIATRQLLVNIDLYVPASYPVPPGTPPTAIFPTIQAAHDYLLQYTIPSDKYATIHVWKGTLAHTAPINLIHPNSRQISIVGQPRVDAAVTQVVWVSSTQKKVIVAAGQELNFPVGAHVWLASVPTPWSGGCTVISTRPGEITLSREKRDTRPTDYNANWSGTGARISMLPTVLTFTTTVLGTQFIYGPNGLRNVQNICAVDLSAPSAAWLFSLADSGIQDCMAWGGLRGFNVGTGALIMVGECVATQCQWGLVGLGVITALEVSYLNACIVGSFANAALGTITGGMDNSRCWIAHCATGMQAPAGKLAEGGQIYFAWCDVGMLADQQSIIAVNPASYLSFPQGNGVDLQARGHSYIQYANHSNPLGVPSCDPANDAVPALASQFSAIHLLLP